MTDRAQDAPNEVDLGAFCRSVEEHLTRVNDGQLIRVVGPAFELVRSWALDGIPLSVVMRGIDLKAERHRSGRSTRPLRLEFCEADVRDVYERWRRSVGIGGSPAVDASTDAAGAPSRRPSLPKHLDRAVARLSRAAGRLDLADAFRDEVTRVLEQVVAMGESARTLRGDARAELARGLPALDVALIDAARAAIGPAAVERFRAEAEADLAAYRSRLTPDAWQRSIDLGVERLVRDHLGLPTLAFDE